MKPNKPIRPVANAADTTRDKAKRASSDVDPGKRGRKPDPTRELNRRIAKLEKENAKLQRENQIQKTLIEFQNKLKTYSEPEAPSSN